MFVVDFMIPVELHDEPDYPPVARMQIMEEMRSEHQKRILQETGVRPPKTGKLIPFLGPQSEVGLRIALLPVLRQEHWRADHPRPPRLTQRPVLREFINEQAARRAASGIKVVRDNIKLSMNALYGSSCRTRRATRLSRLHLLPRLGASGDA
jgi:hypothetical protein